MKLNAVHHIAIICSDYEKSKAFYQNLGFEVNNEYLRSERNSYKTDLSLNGTYTIELFSFPNPPHRLSYPEATGLRHIAFEVDNIETALQELDAKNIPHEMVRIDEYTGKKFIFFKDPDDLPIEFYEK